MVQPQSQKQFGKKGESFQNKLYLSRLACLFALLMMTYHENSACLEGKN